MAITDKHNFVNKDFDYIPSGNIKEYDIKSAGFNILIAKKLLSSEQIKYLEELPKDRRNIEIGLLQRKDKALTKAINEGLKEYRRKFFEANNLESDSVISIKRDAIFVVNAKIKHTQFDNIIFRRKNKYSSYYRINNIELYYSKRENLLDVKGIDDNELYNHKSILGFLKKIIKLNEVSKLSARNYLYDFANRYRKRQLDTDFYREFKSNGSFRLNEESIFSHFEVDNIDDVENINITYNYVNVIIPLIKVIY